MVGKNDHVPAAIADEAAALVNMARNADGQDFDQLVYPQAYFVVRRYKTAAEAAADVPPTTGIPEELYGQVIAVELCRGGHQALFGLARNTVDGLTGAIVAAAGNVADTSDTIFKGRFEAAEGGFPPSMTIDAQGAVTAMTNANISTPEIAGRY